jgi:hypothetical protein
MISSGIARMGERVLLLVREGMVSKRPTDGNDPGRPPSKFVGAMQRVHRYPDLSAFPTTGWW